MRYVNFTLPDGSDWAGVRLRLAWQDEGLVVDLIPQVAFLNKLESRWIHITEDEIEAKLSGECRRSIPPRRESLHDRERNLNAFYRG